MASGGVSDCPCAVGSLIWSEGDVKEEVSMKKMSNIKIMSVIEERFTSVNAFFLVRIAIMISIKLMNKNKK
jgi:hypothetical protein